MTVAPVLRPENHFDTIACRGAESAAATSNGEAPTGGLAATIAALCGGRACRIVSVEAARRLVDGCADIFVARPVELGADGRLRATALRQLAQTIRSGEDAGAPQLLVADDSLASPWLCRPLQMGFDVAIEDLRPWFGVDACALVARSEEALACALTLAGDGVPAIGGDGVLAAERLLTTSLTVQRRCDTAQVVAHFLVMHPSVAWVSYPGLPDDPANDAARRVLEHGFGACLTFGLASAAGVAVSDVLSRAAVVGLRVDAPTASAASALTCGGALTAGYAARTTLAVLPASVSATDGDDGAALGGPVLLLCAGLETPLDVVAALESALAPAK